MRRQIATAMCAALLIAPSSIAAAQQKKARACLAEWQTSKTVNQANGVAEQAFMARCRAGDARTDSGRRTYSTIKDLMESIVDPSADVIWGAVGTIADKQGIQDLSPKTKDEWLDVRRAAVRLVESGNLLMMPGREAAPAGVKSEAPGVELEPAEITVLIKKKRKSFEAFARALQGLGSEALQAAEARNADLLIEIGGRMEEICESCHKTFWYPQEQAAARN
jgi:hypothetical protein